MSATIEQRTLEQRDNVQTIPRLQSGDRLTQREFERRYHAMPEHIKAELIEGVVYMASPVRIEHHALPHAMIMAWLIQYWLVTPGTQCFDNGTVRLGDDSEVQPDIAFRIHESAGGQSFIGPDDYLVGAPELVVEIAASSAAYDLHDKLQVYRRSGVQEYIVWSMYPSELRWLRLHDGAYEQVAPDADGLIQSSVFPGLVLDVAALLQSNMAGVVAAVARGVQSAEHAAFVELLKQHAANA